MRQFYLQALEKKVLTEDQEVNIEYMNETQTINVQKEDLASTQRLSGAEAIIKCLLAEGVDTIFGYPGGAIMPLYDKLYGYY